MVAHGHGVENCIQRHASVLNVIKRNPAFQGLDSSDLEAVAETFQKKNFPQNHPLIEQDREINHIILIVKGAAIISIRDHYGREHVCGRIDSGDFIVDNAIFTGHTAITSIISSEPLECLVQHRTDFLEMLKSHPVLKDVFYSIPIRSVCKNYQAIYRRTRENGVNPPLPGRIPKNIKKSLDIINRCYADPLTLGEVARESGTSRYYFSRLFKKHTGYSFKEYLNLKRVQAAKQLMKEKDLNVSEACFRVGYNDLSYFSRIFKSMEGISPSVFRRDLKENL